VRARVLFGAGSAALFVVSCLVTRGGLIDHRPYGDVHVYGHYAHEMTGGNWPYRDFFDEYPPLAQPLFLVVRVLPGPFTTDFKWVMAAFAGGAILCMLAVLAEVGASWSRVAAAAAVAGLAPLLVGPIFLNTYDLFPALLTAAALLVFVRRRFGLTAALLALATAAKVYPIVLLPLLLIEAWDHGGRDAARRCAVWFAGVFVLVHVPFAIAGPGGLRFSYWVQLKRGLEVESLGAAVLLVLDRLGLYNATLGDRPPGSKDVLGGTAQAVGIVTSVLLVAAIALVVVLFRRSRAVPLAAAAAVVGFVAFSKVFSPQYVDWLFALVPLAGVAASAVLAAVLLLTRVVFDRFHRHDMSGYQDALTWWVFVRDLAVVALYALLVARLSRFTRKT